MPVKILAVTLRFMPEGRASISCSVIGILNLLTTFGRIVNVESTQPLKEMSKQSHYGPGEVQMVLGM